MTQTRARRLLSGAGLTLACWTFLAALFVPQTYFLNLQAPAPLTWWQAVSATLILFYLWAALTPAVLWLGRRFPVERGHLVRNLSVHFFAGFFFTAVHLVSLGYVNSLVLRGADTYRPPAPIVGLLLGIGATDVMIYWGVVSVSQAVTYFRRYQDREFRLVQAQLQSLRTQLHPHFLFNTLNAIAELVYEDAGRAERTVTQLSDLLRLALRRGQRQEVTLKEEVDFLRNYVEIQQTLLQDRLKVRWRVADETLDACVPNMILQPLVENAIRHGIAPRAAGGTIEIEARREGGRLRLRVEDDGLGLGAGARPAGVNGGVGLANTRARLRHLYGDAHEFELAGPPGGRGLAVSLSIPFREGRAENDDEESHADR